MRLTGKYQTIAFFISEILRHLSSSEGTSQTTAANSALARVWSINSSVSKAASRTVCFVTFQRLFHHLPKTVPWMTAQWFFDSFSLLKKCQFKFNIWFLLHCALKNAETVLIYLFRLENTSRLFLVFKTNHRLIFTLRPPQTILTWLYTNKQAPRIAIANLNILF
jgi:hypothetical protein